MQFLKKSKLDSLYSHDIKRAASLANKFSASGYYDDFDAFLEGDFDAVYIAGKNSDHYEQVLKSANMGKHILCEKPLAMNSREAEEMVKVCRENDVKLAVNYTHQFHPLVKKAREILDKEMLGKIVSISMNFNTDFPPNENFRFKISESGGGALRDLGTHLINLLRFFGGEIAEINGYVDNIVYKSEVDDYATGIVKFEKSGYGYFSASFNNKKAFNRIEILGHKGSLSIENLIGKRSTQPVKMTIDLEGEAKKAFRRRANKLVYMLRSVQKSFIEGSGAPVSGEDGLVNMRLMEKLEKGWN
jgi:predicted dehydrogenase